MSSLNVEVTPKRLEILREAIPTATVVAVLLNPTSPTADSQLRNLQEAARALGLQLHDPEQTCAARNFRSAS